MYNFNLSRHCTQKNLLPQRKKSHSYLQSIHLSLKSGRASTTKIFSQERELSIMLSVEGTYVNILLVHLHSPSVPSTACNTLWLPVTVSPGSKEEHQPSAKELLSSVTATPLLHSISIITYMF